MGTAEDLNIFDRAKLLKRMMGDEEIVMGVIRRFLQDTPGRLMLLKEALANGDAGQARLHAHSVKGSSAIVSASALSEAAFRVEIAAESGDIEKAVSLFRDVLYQFDMVKEIISR